MALPKLDAPRYEMTVPSTQEKVVYRPYLVKEEKILMMALESQDEKQMIRAIKDVIAGCTENAIKVNNLTMFDIEYVFTQLRSKSAGEGAKVSLPCDKCETRNDVVIDLSQVVVPKIDKKKMLIEITDDYTLQMRYPSVDAVLGIQTSSSSNIDKVFELIAECADSLHTSDEIFNMKEQTKEEVKEFIESLNTEQFNKVRAFIEDMPSATVNAKFKCSDCGEHNDIEVKGLANFFA